MPRGTAGPRQTRVPYNTCRYCGIEGHWQADCPEKLKKSFKQKGASMMPPGNHNPGRTGQKFNRNNVLSSPSRMKGEIYLEITASGADLLLRGECVLYVLVGDYLTSVKVVVTEKLTEYILCTWDFANNRFAVEGHEAKILDKLSRNAVRRL
jgi:hypothetical protein